MNCCQWLAYLPEAEADQWGAEAVALGRLSSLSIPVTPGFVVSAPSHTLFFSYGPLRRSIEKACKGLDASRHERFAVAARDVRQAIAATPLPADLERSLAAYFEELRHHLMRTKGALSLRLRPAGAFDEDRTISVSAATPQALGKALKQLYALSFTDQGLHRRYCEDSSICGEPFAVIVEHYPEPQLSGTAQCHDSRSMDDTVAEISAVAGSGHGPAATYRVDLKSRAVLSKVHAGSHWSGTATGAVRRPQAHSLAEADVPYLASLARQAQETEAAVCRLRWAKADGTLWVVGIERFQPAAPRPDVRSREQTPVLRGLPAHTGLAVAPVRISGSLKAGEIAVRKTLTPKDLPGLASASGLIVERGTAAGPEGAVARQLQVPAVFGVRQATRLLEEGQLVTLDGRTGNVYRGKVALPRLALPERRELPVTGTHVMATVMDPTTVTAEELALADGVGVLRSEFLLALLKQHPREIISRGRQDEYADMLAEEVRRVALAVAPRPVLYQFHDPLDEPLGGLHVAPHRRQANPKLGYRGAHRLLAEPEFLRLELAALAKAVESGVRNLELLLPMARSTDEISRLQKELGASAFAEMLPLKLWVKCDTPGMAILAEQLPALGIEGVCIDAGQLAQLITGVDHANSRVGHTLDQADEAVLQAVEYVVHSCREQGVASIVTAELMPLAPEVAEAAVRAGVTAVSVAPSVLEDATRMVAAIERRMLLDHVLADTEEPAGPSA